MIEGFLDIDLVGRNDETIAELPFLDAIYRRQSVEREMQLGGIALHPYVTDASGEAGLDVLDADQAHEGRNRVCVRDDKFAFERVA